MGCNRHRRGFTLIELMVSMAIVSLIAVVVFRLFNQMTVAWDSGTKKAEVNMVGRAVTDFMAQELSQAVFDPVILKDIDFQPSEVRFTTIDADPDSATRAARIVRYYRDGSNLMRQVWSWDANQVYSNVVSSGTGTNQVIGTDVQSLSFQFFPASTPTWCLPGYAEIVVGIQRAEDKAKGGTTNFFQARAYFANRNRYYLE